MTRVLCVLEDDAQIVTGAASPTTRQRTAQLVCSQGRMRCVRRQLLKCRLDGRGRIGVSSATSVGRARTPANVTAFWVPLESHHGASSNLCYFFVAGFKHHRNFVFCACAVQFGKPLQLLHECHLMHSPSSNVNAQPPGPPARTGCLEKPNWRPRAVAAFCSARADARHRQRN